MAIAVVFNCDLSNRFGHHHATNVKDRTYHLTWLYEYHRRYDCFQNNADLLHVIVLNSIAVDCFNGLKQQILTMAISTGLNRNHINTFS